MKVREGKYKHYEGQMYEVLGEALNTNDDSTSVVYRSLDGTKMYVMPLEIFKEEVEVRGHSVQRFQFIV